MALTPQQLIALGPDELARLGRDATLLEAQTITYASSMTVSLAGNDMVMAFARPRPVILPTGEVPPFMKSEITAIIYTSVQTIKDFYLALKDQIDRYEAANGKIVTEYTKQSEQ
jgi:hypothetical protein